MFIKTRNQMNNWRSDSSGAFDSQVNHSNAQITGSENVKPTSEHFSSYGSNDPRAMIEPPSCQEYKPGEFLAIRPVNWDAIIQQDDDDENWADPRAPSVRRSHPSDWNANDDKEVEEDTQGGEQGTGKWKGTKDG